MKFLGWMHRKLMQNNTETMKNSMIGNPFTCVSEQTLFDEQNYSMETTETLSHSNIKCQKSSNGFKASTVKLPLQEPFEPFDFLSIGTFGMELLNADPPTPTLPMPYEKLTNQLTEITENDLKLISYELEKFLEAEEKEIANDTSERSSMASIITLSNNLAEETNSEGHMHKVACPLQNYLFANATELAETDKEVKKEKTSLEELFKRNSTVCDNHTEKCEGAEQPHRKKIACNFMKKVVKKFHSSSSGSMASSKNNTAKSISIKKKLSKALKILHKKVHPAEMTEEQIVNLPKDDKKEIVDDNACLFREDAKNTMALQATNKKNENTMKPSSNGICKGASTITGGHWIKTDSDYLVLEL